MFNWPARRLRFLGQGFILLVVLVGTGAGIFLLQTNLDLRQQAATFNFGRTGEQGSKFTVNGQTISSAELTLQDEPFRQNPSLIIANGHSEPLVFILKQGGDTLKEEVLPEYSVKELPLEVGNFSALVVRQADNQALYETALIVEPNTLHLLIHGKETRYQQLSQLNAPLARIYNLTDDTEFSISSPDITGERIPIASQQYSDPYSIKTTSLSLTLNGTYSSLKNQTINIQNAPLHRLFLFVMGDKDRSEISLATIPLPPQFLTEPNMQVQVTGEEKLDALIAVQTPVKTILEYLEFNFYEADQVFILRTPQFGTNYNGYAKVKHFPTATVVWSKLPAPPESSDVRENLSALLQVSDPTVENWTAEQLKQASLLGWYVTLPDQSLVSVKVLPRNPEIGKGDSLLSVAEFSGRDANATPTIDYFGLPIRLIKQADGTYQGEPLE